MRLILTFLIFNLISAFSQATSLSIEGSYQGKNLYVQNPMDDDGFGYCATKVTVNGDIMPGGTSMGAVVGGLYASGYNATQIDSIFFCQIVI